MSNASRFLLTVQGAATPWIDLRGISSDTSAIITGFTGVLQIRYSNNEDLLKGTDYIVDGTDVVEATGRTFPFSTARFIQFFLATLTTGQAAISFAKAKDPNGQLVDVTVQVIA